MKTFLIVSLLCFGSGLVLNPSYAASTKKRSRGLSQAPQHTPVTTRLHVGPGFVILESHSGVGLNAGLTFKADKTLPIFVGAELNYYHTDAAGLGINYFSLLATAYYRLINVHKTLTPYFGLSLGPNIRDIADPFGTDVSLEFMIRSGVEFRLTPKFSVAFEPKWGIAHGDFSFLPFFLGVIELD